MSEEVKEPQEDPKVLIDDKPDEFFKSVDNLRDYLTKQNRLSVYTDSPAAVEFFKSDKNMFSINTGQGKYPLSEGGFNRLCKILKVPPKFLLKLPSDNVFKDLKASLYKTQVKGLNFIIKNDVIVGIGEKPETTSALEVVDRVFTGNQYTIKNVGISAEDLVVDFVRDSTMPLINDNLYYGLSFKHSDSDGAHPQMSHYVWRQVCSNGLIVSHLEKLAKFSNRMPKEKMFEILTDRVRENIDLISSSLHGLVNTMNETKVPQEERRFIKDFLEKKMDFENHNDLSEKYDSLITKKEEATHYDLMNFITDSAKNFSVLERRRIEMLGGQLMLNFKSESPSLEIFSGYQTFKFNALRKEQENN